MIRFTREGDAVPVGFPGSSAVWPRLGSVGGARNDPVIARRAAVSIAASMVRGGAQSVLLIDDAQWTDEDLRVVFGVLARRLAGGPATCVCAVRTPAAAAVSDGGAAWVRRLREDGLLDTMRLRPMTTAAIRGMLTAMTKARPDAALVAEVVRLSRGIPAAVRDTVKFLRHTESIRSVGGTAFLVGPANAVDPAAGNEFVRLARGLGEPAYSVAKAMAMLAPFGAGAPRLVAEALDLTTRQTAAVLHLLCQEGILHRGQGGRTWRFPIPLVASALVARMGPFERRQLAARGVRAAWAGDVDCADLDHFTDLVADAGRMVDARPALAVLLPRLTGGGECPARSVSRWLVMALELTEDRSERAAVMRKLIAVCMAQGEPRRAFGVAQFLLTEFADELSSEVANEVQAATVRALKSIGNVEALRDIAEFRRRWPGDAAQCFVTRAHAFTQLDRWREARDLLSDNEYQLPAAPVRFGSVLGTIAELWTGRPESLEYSVAFGGHETPTAEERLTSVDGHVAALLGLGDSARAEKLLVEEDIPVTRLRLGNRAALAALRGDTASALDLAKRILATRADQGHATNSAAMWQLIVGILVAQGNLSMARDLLYAVRATRPPLAHLLDIAEAAIENALGNDEGAAEKLRECLATEEERGLLVGSDLCWSMLAEIALVAGDEAEARRCLAGIERVAQAMPADRAVAGARLVRATVGADREAAGECLRMVRERGQPFELADAAKRLVQHGIGDPALLRDAYEVLGRLDVLLLRSWLRGLMRKHDVVVPGRTETLAENERVLAMLAADGLANKQLAVALRTSEGSVESRLSRLFARTGFRSRIELSTAILDGEL